MKILITVLGLLLSTPVSATNGERGVATGTGSSRSTACVLAQGSASLSTSGRANSSIDRCRCEKDDDAHLIEKWHCQVSYSYEDSDSYENGDKDDGKRNGRSGRH